MCRKAGLVPDSCSRYAVWVSKNKLFPGWLKVTALLLSSGLGVAGLAYWLLWNGHIWLNMPSFRNYPIQGLDVSAHQGEIDWP